MTPRRHGDSRGHLAEVFRKDWFESNIAQVEFVQENQSLTESVGVVRGLHFQSPPMAQGKLVRCLSGKIFDVAVDIRAGSPTFGKWVSAILSSAVGNQLWIPPGFAHGFCTLEPNALVCYKVTSFYSRDHDHGVMWNDPMLDIKWPSVANPSLTSERDGKHPPFENLPSYFQYTGCVC